MKADRSTTSQFHHFKMYNLMFGFDSDYMESDKRNYYNKDCIHYIESNRNRGIRIATFTSLAYLLECAKWIVIIAYCIYAYKHSAGICLLLFICSIRRHCILHCSVFCLPRLSNNLRLCTESTDSLHRSEFY